MTTTPQVSVFFARERDVLILAGEFQPLIDELDLHVLSNGLDYDPFVHQVLVDALMALGLHLASRPADEYAGWTISLQQPRLNLFCTGSSQDEAVVGRAFIDEQDVRERASNLFVVQSRRPGTELHESYVDVEGVDVFAMAEAYYARSEQKLVRYVFAPGLTAMVQALPDVDVAWFQNLDGAEVQALRSSKEVEPWTTRRFAFRCGCDRKRIIGTVRSSFGSALDELFGGAPTIDVGCPRCGAQLTISRKECEE